MFHVLQIRPISADGLTAKVDWEQVDCSKPIISSGSALGVGKVEGVRDIIYLKKEAFDILRTREMAETIRAWNKQCQAAGTPYVLIGFGRWGSQIPTLGVPVQWSDISEAKALVECSLEDFRVDPSQGSHFFQNMTSFNVGYINVDPFARSEDKYDFAQLDAMTAVEETELVRHVRVFEDLNIYIDGYNSRALVSGEWLVVSG